MSSGQTEKEMKENNRIRVCHVMLGMDVGGAEKFVVDLTRTLQDVEFFLFCLDSKGKWYEDACVKARECMDTKVGEGWYLSGVNQLVDFIRRHRIDVLHAHTHRTHIYCVLAHLITHIPVIVTFHGSGFGYMRRTLLERKFMSYATARMVAVSEATRKAVCEKTGIPSRKVAVIRNGVDVRHFVPVESSDKVNIRRLFGIPEKAFVIGSTGRLSREKNYKMLVRCFARLRTVYPDVWLIIAGDGVDRPEIESELRHSGVSNYCILSGIQSDVLPWLHAMDVFCLTSLTEGCSIALLEACSCGLPAVVTDTGGNAEIVKHNVSGFVVPVHDEIAYTESLKLLHENTTMRKQMGSESAKIVSEFFTIERTAQNYRRLYREVVGYAEH
jgi:glycosyltransferase involved in cell wall biosynthesis